MGKKLVEILTPDLEANVPNSILKQMAIDALEKCDDLNAIEPASSTGKYHPIADLGYQGLIRHSRMVAKVASIMIRGNPEFDGIKGQEVYIAGLLHDMCKYAKDENSIKVHTRFDHPTAMATLFTESAKETVKKLNEEKHFEGEILNQLKDTIQNISGMIASHMSRWNTSKYAEGVELPLPTTMGQWILSYADLVAANSDLPETMFEFKEEAVKYLAGRKEAK